MTGDCMPHIRVVWFGLRCDYINVDNMAACAKVRTVISRMKLELLGRDEMSGSDQDPPGNNTMPVIANKTSYHQIFGHSCSNFSLSISNRQTN